MKRGLICLLALSMVLGMPGWLYAQVAVLTNTGINVNMPDGSVIFVPNSKVIDGRDGNTPTPPGPDDPDDPIPPTPTSVAERVREIADAVNDEIGSKLLSVIYREAAKHTNQNRKTLLDFIKEASDTGLKTVGTFDKWRTARGAISSLIDREEAGGNPDYKKLFNAIADGLESAGQAVEESLSAAAQMAAEEEIQVPEYAYMVSAALPPALWNALIQLIFMLISKWFGNDVGLLDRRSGNAKVVE